jgi:hypothetical protein
MLTAAAWTGVDKPPVSALPAVRRAAVCLALAAVTSLAAAAPAAAHLVGRYDASRPLYVKGVVTDSSDGYPHGIILIDPAPPTRPPADLHALDAGDYKALGGRRVVSRARPVRATGSGALALLLTPAMYAEVSELDYPPERGDEVGAIVFRECDTDELLVELLRLSSRERVVRSTAHGDVDGCKDRVPEEDGWSDDGGEPSSAPAAGSEQAEPSGADGEPGTAGTADRGPGASNSRADSAANSVPVATVDPTDDGGLPPLLMVAGVVGSGLAALGGGLLAGRARRRQR